MKTRINLSVYLIVLFFTLTACGERTDGLYGTRYSRSELEEIKHFALFPQKLSECGRVLYLCAEKNHIHET